MAASPKSITFNCGDSVKVEFDSNSDKLTLTCGSHQIRVKYGDLRDIMDFINDIDFED